MLVYMSSIKKYQFSPFYNLMLVLGKIQDASRANTHKVLYNPILLRRSKAFHGRYEILLKYRNVSKNRRALHHPANTLPPTPSLTCTTVGV